MWWWFFTGITLLTIVVQMINHWYLQSHKLNIAFPLTIVVYTLCFIGDTALGLRYPEQSGILLWNIPHVWAIGMAIMGMRKLKREKAAKLAEQLKNEENQNTGL